MYRKVNTDFFKSWSEEMAYVLGFFAADGNMIKGSRGNHFISFNIADKQILESIRRALTSNHKIATRERDGGCKTSYQLQIGSKEIFSDLLELGMTPNKTNTLKFPKVPVEYLSHFVRGYFDGDGSVSYCIYQKNDRKCKSKTLLTRFTCGSSHFLKGLYLGLHEKAGLQGGSLKYFGRAWRLNYSVNDSLCLFTYMYQGYTGPLYLKRKRAIFEKFLKQRRNARQ